MESRQVPRLFRDAGPDKTTAVIAEDALIFQPEMQAAFEELLGLGLVDVFRAKYPHKADSYTWWGPKHPDRADNQGSRLDYFLVSEELFPHVQSIRHRTDVFGSDHCPVSLIIHPAAIREEISDDVLAVRWETIDWPAMEEKLFALQKEIAVAADLRDWLKVYELQDTLVKSYSARMMAVREVADTNSAAGVDGVKLKTSVQKMKLALSLTPKDYVPLPST